MKTKFILTILTLFLVTTLIASASAKTIVAGKIYNADYSATVSGAGIEVICNAIEKTATSLSDGTYSVEYASDNGCSIGKEVSVHASKTGVGENTVTGIMQDLTPIDLTLGVVNVPLIPEFGFAVGALTLASAIGVFFVVRRK
jgi:hypothetical protein